MPTLRLMDAENVQTLGFVLNLTDDQKTKIQDLLTKSSEEQKPKIEAQIKAMEDYVGLLGKNDAAQADLAAASEKVLKAEGDIMASRIAALIGLRAILNPEQNKKLSDALSESAARWLPPKAAPAETPAAPSGK